MEPHKWMRVGVPALLIGALLLYFAPLYFLWYQPFADAFWPGFFSNLGSTVIGVALGVPIALWFDRRAQEREQQASREAEKREQLAKQEAREQEERSKRTEERRRLMDALETLRTSLVSNRDQLAELEQVLYRIDVNSPDPRLNFGYIEVHINTETWAAVRGEVLPFLHNPKLQAEIADHFSMLDTLVKLLDRYAEQSLGTASALGNSNMIRGEVRELLIRQRRACHRQAVDLIAALGMILDGQGDPMQSE